MCSEDACFIYFAVCMRCLFTCRMILVNLMFAVYWLVVIFSVFRATPVSFVIFIQSASFQLV